MKSKSAFLPTAPGPWQIEDLDLSEPGPGEVLVRIEVAGLCHSDQHFATGDVKAPHLPMVGGHEGAGVVEAVGPGVGSVAPGDHVVTIFTPNCAKCRWCLAGLGNLCDSGVRTADRTSGDRKFRFHRQGEGVDQMALLGTFAQWTVVAEQNLVVIPKEVPFASAALLGCAIPTGWGSAVSAGAVGMGDTVIVMGSGATGVNAVQGAKHVGAEHILAVDPVAYKRDLALRFGATETFADIEEAAERARELTGGLGADVTVVTVGVLAGSLLTEAVSSIRKAGTVVVTAAGNSGDGVLVDASDLMRNQKRIQGALYGGASPLKTISDLIELYLAGDVLLDELVTSTYELERINEGYAELSSGKDLCGVVTLHP